MKFFVLKRLIPSCVFSSAYFARLFFRRLIKRVERNGGFPEKYKSPLKCRYHTFLSDVEKREETLRSRAVWGNGYFTSVAIKPHCYITAGAVINHSREEAISHPGDCIRLAWRLLYYARVYVCRCKTWLLAQFEVCNLEPITFRCESANTDRCVMYRPSYRCSPLSQTQSFAHTLMSATMFINVDFAIRYFAISRAVVCTNHGRKSYRER